MVKTEKGIHWTQLPENKKFLVNNARKQRNWVKKKSRAEKAVIKSKKIKHIKIKHVDYLEYLIDKLLERI